MLHVASTSVLRHQGRVARCLQEAVSRKSPGARHAAYLARTRGSACAPSPLPRWSAFAPPAAARSARVDAALQGGRLGRLRVERRLALGGRVGRRGEAEVRQGRQLREAPIKPRRHMASRQRPAPHRPGYLEPSAGRRLLVAAVLSCDGRSRVWPAYPRRCNDVTAAGAARGATGAAGGRFGDCEWLLAPMTCCVQDNV